MRIQRDIWESELLVKRGRCGWCDSPNGQVVAYRHDGLAVVECTRCRLAYVDPRPSSEQLRNYYNSGYFQGQRDFFSGQDYCEARHHAILDKTVTGYAEITSSLDIHGKTILEVGCGSGALLQLLKDHQPAKMIGLDRAQYPIEYGRSHYHLDVRWSTLEAERFPEGTFDLVILIDVIEHIEDLTPFLHELAKILRAGGHLFLITPNYGAFSIARSRWSCLHKDFEHLQYFSPSSLESLAARTTLELVHWWTRGIPVLLSSYPRLYKKGLHRLRYPWVSLSNFVKKAKYRPLLSLQKDFGSDLCAILQKKVEL